MTREEHEYYRAEISAWQQRYQTLLEHMSSMALPAVQPPMMLPDKESYELGKLHGAAEEREACAKVCDQLRDDAGCNSGRIWTSGCATSIRARDKA